MSDLTSQPPLRRRPERGDPDLSGVDAAPDAPAAVRPPVLEPPSPDVVAAPAESRIPGSHRDGYRELPTAPVIAAETGPIENDPVRWEPSAPARRAVVGPWALGLAIVALAASIFVGWLLPVGLAGVVAAIVTLRRPGESRSVGVWALVLALVSLVYSAGWLLWAIPQLPGF